MGRRVQYICKKCSYEAMVGAGRQIGFTTATLTVHCPECKTISDVKISNEPWDPLKDLKLGELSCPLCSGPVKRWKVGICPKCGGKMTIEGGELWD
jgi:hypothetical protein